MKDDGIDHPRDLGSCLVDPQGTRKGAAPSLLAEVHFPLLNPLVCTLAMPGSATPPPRIAPRLFFCRRSGRRPSRLRRPPPGRTAPDFPLRSAVAVPPLFVPSKKNLPLALDSLDSPPLHFTCRGSESDADSLCCSVQPGTRIRRADVARSNHSASQTCCGG